MPGGAQWTVGGPGQGIGPGPQMKGWEPPGAGPNPAPNAAPGAAPAAPAPSPFAPGGPGKAEGAGTPLFPDAGQLGTNVVYRGEGGEPVVRGVDAGNAAGPEARDPEVAGMLQRADQIGYVLNAQVADTGAAAQGLLGRTQGQLQDLVTLLKTAPEGAANHPQVQEARNMLDTISTTVAAGTVQGPQTQANLAQLSADLQRTTRTLDAGFAGAQAGPTPAIGATQPGQTNLAQIGPAPQVRTFNQAGPAQAPGPAQGGQGPQAGVASNRIFPGAGGAEQAGNAAFGGRGTATQPGQPQVIDANGRPIQGATAADQAGNAIPGARVMAAANGQAQVVDANGRTIPGASVIDQAGTAIPGARMTAGQTGQAAPIVDANGRAVAAIVDQAGTAIPGARVVTAANGQAQVVDANGRTIPGANVVDPAGNAVPGARMAGQATQVVDANGRAIPGAAVVDQAGTAIPGARMMAGQATQVVDANGRPIPGAAVVDQAGTAIPGARVVTAANGQAQIVDATGRTVPGASFVDQAGNAVPGARMAGQTGQMQVVDANGRAIPGAAIVDQAGNAIPGARVVTAANGQAQVVDGTGRTIPGAAVVNQAGSAISAARAVDPSGGAAPLRAPQPAVALPNGARIVDQAGAAVPGARVIPAANAQGAQIVTGAGQPLPNARVLDQAGAPLPAALLLPTARDAPRVLDAAGRPVPGARIVDAAGRALPGAQIAPSVTAAGPPRVLDAAGRPVPGAQVVDAAGTPIQGARPDPEPRPSSIAPNAAAALRYAAPNSTMPAPAQAAAIAAPRPGGPPTAAEGALSSSFAARVLNGAAPIVPGAPAAPEQPGNPLLRSIFAAAPPTAPTIDKSALDALLRLPGPMGRLLVDGVMPGLALAAQQVWESAMLGGWNSVAGAALQPLWQRWGLENAEQLDALVLRLTGEPAGAVALNKAADLPSRVGALLLRMPVQDLPDVTIDPRRMEAAMLALGASDFGAGLNGLIRLETVPEQLGGARALTAVGTPDGSPLLLAHLRPPPTAESRIALGAGLAIATGAAGPGIPASATLSWAGPAADPALGSVGGLGADRVADRAGAVLAQLVQLTLAGIRRGTEAPTAMAIQVPFDGGPIGGAMRFPSGKDVKLGAGFLPAAGPGTLFGRGPAPAMRVTAMLGLGGLPQQGGVFQVLGAHVTYDERRAVPLDTAPVRLEAPSWRMDDTQVHAAIGPGGIGVALAGARRLYQRLMAGKVSLDGILPGHGVMTWDGSPTWLGLARVPKAASAGVLPGEADPPRVELLRAPEGDWLLSRTGGSEGRSSRMAYASDSVDDVAFYNDVVFGLPHGMDLQPVPGPAGALAARGFRHARAAMAEPAGGDALSRARRAEAWGLLARLWAGVAERMGRTGAGRLATRGDAVAQAGALREIASWCGAVPALVSAQAARVDMPGLLLAVGEDTRASLARTLAPGAVLMAVLDRPDAAAPAPERWDTLLRLLAAGSMADVRALGTEALADLGRGLPDRVDVSGAVAMAAALGRLD